MVDAGKAVPAARLSVDPVAGLLSSTLLQAGWLFVMKAVDLHSCTCEGTTSRKAGVTR